MWHLSSMVSEAKEFAEMHIVQRERRKGERNQKGNQDVQSTRERWMNINNHQNRWWSESEKWEKEDSEGELWMRWEERECAAKRMSARMFTVACSTSAHAPLEWEIELIERERKRDMDQKWKEKQSDTHLGSYPMRMWRVLEYIPGFPIWKDWWKAEICDCTEVHKCKKYIELCRYRVCGMGVCIYFREIVMERYNGK